jgi:protein-disulfide isomerase
VQLHQLAANCTPNRHFPSEEQNVSRNTRQWIIIVAAVVIVAAGAIYFFVSRSAPVVIEEQEGQSQAEAPAAGEGGELMVAGPLGEAALGDPNAPNVVIEYASMTCPHCQRFHSAVYPEFKEKYIDTGEVYFIFREYPLDPLATSASMLARCAPDDRFFPIIDLLFDQQAAWASASDPVNALRDLVKQAGISEDEFNACLTNQEILDGVNWVHNRAAEEFGVNSTPTFFFNGEKHSGEQSIEDIDRILNG